MKSSLEIIKKREFAGHIGAVYGLAYNDKHNCFFSAGGDVWIVKGSLQENMKEGQLIAQTDTKLFSLGIDTSGNLLIAGDIKGHLYWIDIVENKILGRFDMHKGSIFDICMLNKQYVMTVGGDGYFCVWDIVKRLPVYSYRLSLQGLRCIKYNPLSGLIYVGASDNNIYIIRYEDWEVIHAIKNAHQNSVFCLEVVRDKYLISGGRDAHLIVRDVSTYDIIQDLNAHWYTINKIQYIPEENLLVTASRDKTMRWWSAENFQLLKTINVQGGGHIHSINNIQWIPENKALISGGDDKILKEWHCNRREL